MPASISDTPAVAHLDDKYGDLFISYLVDNPVLCMPDPK
jgi:hypothetical protein